MNCWSLNNEKIGHYAGFTDIAFFLALTLHMKKATWASSHPSHSSLDGRFIFSSTGNLWAQVCSWKYSNRLTRHAPAASKPASAGRSTHREVTSLKRTPFIHRQCGNSQNAHPPPQKKKNSKLISKIALRHPQKGSRDFLNVLLYKPVKKQKCHKRQ